jgi:RHS repeat-associated protein
MFNQATRGMIEADAGRLGLTGSPGRFTYNGNEFDDEYGFDLYYYGARYMDPALGRFTTRDPVKDFINPYSYVRNNPMNRIDPVGKTSNDIRWSSTEPFGSLIKGFWEKVKELFDDPEWENIQRARMRLNLQLEQLKQQADAMKSKNDPSVDKDYWGLLSDALGEILEDPSKFDDLFAIKSELYSEDPQGNVRTVNSYWNQEDRKIYFSARYVNDPNVTDLQLRSTIIHEYAHEAYYIDNPSLDSRDWQQYRSNQIYATERQFEHWEYYGHEPSNMWEQEFGGWYYWYHHQKEYERRYRKQFWDGYLENDPWSWPR